MRAVLERAGSPEEILRLEETDAWLEYLHETRGKTGRRYVEVETWAWAKLQQRLRTIAARRQAAA